MATKKVSADSVQIYRGLDIGALAAPSRDGRRVSERVVWSGEVLRSFARGVPETAQEDKRLEQANRRGLGCGATPPRRRLRCRRALERRRVEPSGGRAPRRVERERERELPHRRVVGSLSRSLAREIGRFLNSLACRRAREREREEEWREALEASPGLCTRRRLRTARRATSARSWSAAP